MKARLDVTMNRPVTPESVLSNDDPGDDTQRRFRYQNTYAAIISLSLLKEESETDYIFCEHHEDVLVKQKDGSFVGIQIKTQLDSKGLYKAGDKPIINSLQRFIKLESQFPEAFSQYVIAVNTGFWHEKENNSNLPYLLKLARNTREESITPQECLSTFAKKFSFKNEDIKVFNADGTVSDFALRVLSKVITQEDLPKLEKPEGDLIEEIAKLPDMSQRGYDGLKKLAKALVNEMFCAASLANNSSQPLYFYLLNDSAEQKTKAIIQGKQITREKILKIIQEHSSTQILDIGKAEEEAQQEQVIEKQVIAYRQKLISGLSNLQIFKMSRPLNLEKVYVPLRVRQEEKLPSAKEEERVSLAGGQPTEVLRLFQGRLAEQAATATSPEEALSRLKKITVLGEPGAGKTTILRHLAVKMADGALPSLPDLPVYVELRSFVESGMEDLLDFVVSDCAKPYNFPDRFYLEEKLNDGEAALLLDGLDEVLGGKRPEDAKKAYNRLAKIATDLATQFSNAPIVVACRRAGWQGGLTGFHTLEVLDFDESQIQKFVNNWFKSDRSKAKGLQEELEKNLRMKTLAANPLIISLMAIVYGRELELPERRSELYQHCVEVLLEEWDSEPNRGIQRFNQFTPTQMQNLLIEVAWYFHQQGKGYFREAELLQQLSSFLSNSDINIPLQENKAILEEITGSSSLLKEAAYKLYGFLHLTFQEYFAALAAKKKGSIGWQEVVAHRHEPWWEEVILLLAECMDDATPLLLGILGHPLGQSGDINQLVPEGEELAANDDLFDSDLLLAARCLAGKPTIQMHGLRDRIIAEVKTRLLSSPYKLDWQRTAKVLVEIGDTALIDELLEMLVPIGRTELERRTNVVDLMEKRFSIASACGQHGDRNVAERLLNLLERRAELDGQVLGRVSYALAELRAVNAVPQLLAMFGAETNDWIKLSLAAALIELGEKFIAPELMDMLIDEERFDEEKIPLLELVGSSGDKSVAPKLLQMLLADTTSTSIKPAIAQALRDLKDSSLVSSILERLQDETTGWEIRWLLTESLEGLQESAIASLREILGKPNIDKRVRVGIAATLGTWGEQESINHLREAIENQVVPPNWCLGNSNWIGYIWRRITSTLKSLGDQSILPALVKSLEQSTSNWKEGGLSSRWFIRDDMNKLSTVTTQYNASTCEVKGIIFAALEYEPDVIAQQVLQILRQQTSRSFQEELLRTLPKLATKSLVPELLHLLAERGTYTAQYKTWVSVVKAISEVGDDRETVRALLEVGSSLSSQEESYLEPAIYQALYSVSRRARVRVSRNEQIEELKTKNGAIEVGNVS